MKTMNKLLVAGALMVAASGAMADITDPLTTTNNTNYCSNAKAPILGFVAGNATPAKAQNKVAVSGVKAVCALVHPCAVPLYMSKVGGTGSTPCAGGNMVATGVMANIDTTTEAITFSNGGKGSFTDSTGAVQTVQFSTPGKMQVAIN